MNYYYGTQGLGVIWLDSEALWADQVAGSPVKFGGQGDNFRGNRWAKAMQTGLNDAGYKGADGKPLTVDGSWYKNSFHAWRSFAADHNLPVQDYPSSAADIQALQDVLNPPAPKGEQPVTPPPDVPKPPAPVKPVPKPPVKPAPAKPPPPKKAGISVGMALGLAALVALGFAAVVKAKRKKLAHSSTALAKANKRRRARRNAGGHKKIDIYVKHPGQNWSYWASTESHPTCKSAEASICSKYGFLPSEVKAHFDKRARRR